MTTTHPRVPVDDRKGEAHVPLSQLLSRLIKVGTLHVIDAEGRHHKFGGHTPGLAVTMKLADPLLYRKLFLSPELAAGEAYMDGTLSFPGSSLREFLSLVSLNQNRSGGKPTAFHRTLATISRRLKRFQQSNP